MHNFWLLPVYALYFGAKMAASESFLETLM